MIAEPTDLGGGGAEPKPSMPLSYRPGEADLVKPDRWWRFALLRSAFYIAVLWPLGIALILICVYFFLREPSAKGAAALLCVVCMWGAILSMSMRSTISIARRQNRDPFSK